MATLQRIHAFRFGLALLLALGVALLMQPVPARAETIIVTSDADSGAGTLRQAIADAQPGDVIVFNGSMSIYLNSQLEVAKSLTIDGGAYTVVVSGDSDNNGSSDVRVLQVTNNAHVTLAHLTLRDGYAWGDSGGGLKLEAGTVVTLTHSSVLNSVALHGGGIFNAGALMVQNSLLFDNTAAGGNGGGIYNYQGALTVQNSTLSENGVSNNGGGIVNYQGALTVQNSTFSGNNAMSGSGGGLYNFADSTLNVQNTIIANSPNGGDCVNGGGVLTSTYNLVGDGSCSAALSGDPLLGPLADNGGATLTYALLDGSPALEAGDNATCLPTDQRDVARPQGAACDIGAFERIWALNLSKTVTPTTHVAYHGLVTYTLVLSNVSNDLQSDVWLTDTLPAEVDFVAWVISPTNTTLSGAEIRWRDDLAVGQVVTWTFQARHAGEYRDHVVNLARFSSGISRGSAAAGFDVECAPSYPAQNAADSGPGSLRQAIIGICPGSVITFSGDADIYLNSTLVISQDLTIDGNGYRINLSGDSGNNGSPDVRVLQVTNGARVTLAHLTLLHGKDTSACVYSFYSCGGGLKVETGAVVTLTDSTVFSSTAEYGGGIFNSGALLVQNSAVFSATADSGGGIYNTGALTIQHSALSDNSVSTFGGGLHNAQGALTMRDSTLSGNTARDGGGIYNTGVLTVQHSTLADNATSQDGGGIHNYLGALTIQNSTLSSNTSDRDGGGIYNDLGVVTVQNSTLANNGALNGGGLCNQTGTLTVQNSTLSGNGADYGGGIVNQGTLIVQNSTLASNTANSQGGGIYNSGSLDYQNTIVANNWANYGHDCRNDGGSVTSSYNLVGDGSCNATFSGDPALGVLTDNGGDTRTHALLPHSPAIDAGDPATCLPTDQRGFPRADLRCDIGAFELQHADSHTVSKAGMAAGAQASFGPTRLRVTVTGGGAGTITATKHLTTPGGVYDTGEITATWYLTASASPFTVTLAFCYTPEELGDLNAVSLQAFRWDTSALTWTLPISTGLTVAEGCVTLTGIEQFSAWTLKDVSVGADKPTAARVVALTARGVAPLLAGLLALGGVAAFTRRRQR